jgi:sulfite exporter TauE/SafE
MQFLAHWGVLGAFVAGMVGGVLHCTFMCGGFVLAVGRTASPADRWNLPLFQLGRITTYALLAFALAMLGEGADWLAPAAGRKVWSLVLGLTMLLLAFSVGYGGGIGGGRLAAVFSRQIGRLLRGARRLGRPGRIVAGLAWGLLPCAFSWAAIVAAAGSGPLRAPATAAAFGVGTAIPLAALARLDRRMLQTAAPWSKHLVAGLLAAWGIWMIVRGLR